jgi:predicted secreted protein
MNWMKPDAARAVMARLAASAATLLALTLPAMAGDRALIDYVGFSADFRYFAFEEFGIQDGSGFAYSNIYVVDLQTDSWVIGTPVRVQAESEETSLVDIRAEAARLAAGHVDEFDLTVPVEIAAMIGDGVPDTDAATLDFGAPGYLPGAVSGNYRLELTTYETTAVSPCEDWFGVNPKGYALTITDKGGERLIHRDAGLPRSRGCPLDYRLHSVLMPFEGATLSNAVAIISVYPGGFEGPDRRFLAVPLGL